ncbi:ras guanine nucleotide exchange factor domain-containing protein [Russula emetica]|nr:ras guanine nucleotide exchange factor domain-containing protein [Russula emetica]
MAPRQPTRSAALFIDLPQGRNREPVNPVVLGSMETAACDSERLLRHATDGTVSAGNLEGLVSRVITDIEDPSRDDRIRETFLTIYQLFATSERLFHILKRRFESSELDPVATSSRFSILLFIESWLKKGFADEDLKCTSMIKQLVLPLVDSETISEKMEAKAKEIARLIDDPDYVLLRQPKNYTALRSEDAERPQGVTPTDLAAALTVVEGDRFKCITYWDYVNFTRWQPNVQRIEVFNIVHDLVKVWVQRTVLKSDFLEERMGMYEEWIYTAKECRALNNFSSTSAIVLGLMSPLVSALVLTCESKAKSDLYALAKELTPTDGVYQNTLEKVATRDLIPWLGTIDTVCFIRLATNLTRLAHADRHLSTLNSSFADSIPIVEVDGHPLIDFKQCSNIAEQIDTLVQYSPPRTHHTTRPDLLAYVEYSLKCSRSNAVLRNAEERSARLAEEERVFYAQRKKMTGLGFAWSPPRRRK